MRDLAGRTAFITGAASGIGRALAGACAAAGMRVALADIEPAALDAAVAALRETGADAIGLACDVADPASLDHAAKAAIAAYGRVHLLCNNAGVGGGSGSDAISLETWRWVIDVNLMGVVHGIHAFLPHISGHGEGGHILNTASMAGLDSGLGFSAYSASKHAVVNISEGLASELKPHDIGVTVLCPGFVRTNIWTASRNRPQRYGPAIPGGRLLADLAARGAAGLDPETVAARSIAAIRADELYVFTHAGPDWRAGVASRFEVILAAMDMAAGGG
jgi:NAD(P)-dependent dehydrogenase (short-subunit alcohol dehydrogenase family)